MTQKNAKNVKLTVSMLTLCLVAPNALLAEAQAGMITGVAPEVINGNKVYNIDPTVLNGDTGFRLYEYFKLNKDEVANLIFKYGEHNISKFVNLVDNQININGLVNSVNKDGSFNNGHVMFISPNGMVVGASGVLNLGSLTVLTPEQNNYNKFKSDYDIRGTLSDNLTDLYSQGTGTVTIDGKVIARDAVDIRAAAVNVNNTIMAGVNDSRVINTNSDADILFNSLVNTDNLKTGNAFASESGSIKITAYSGSEGVNIAKGSDLKNFGKGDIEVTSYGDKGIVADGDIKNPGGNVRLTTTKGTITANGNIVNFDGNTELTSANGILLSENASITNKNGNTILTNKGTIGIDAKGSIENTNGDLIFNNSADGGITIDGAPVSNKNGNLSMTNSGAAGTTINGTVTNTNGNSTYTNEAGAFTVNGFATNTDGNLDINNSGTGINITSEAKVLNLESGDLEMTNTGVDGILIDGLVSNANGNSTYLNENGSFVLNNRAENANGTMSLTNNGTGIKIAGTFENRNGDLSMINTGAEGIVIDGSSVNYDGNSTYLNEAGEFTVNNKVSNINGNLKITNNGTGIKVAKNGMISNTNGDLTVENIGENGILVNGSVINDVGNLSMTNSGLAGITINGTSVNTNGNSVYLNNNGSLTVNGEVFNDGDLTMTNNYAEGENGFNIAGNVTNNTGAAVLVNNGGNDFHIQQNGVVTSNGTSLTVQNTRSGLVIDGTVNSNSDTMLLENTGAAGLIINGNVNNNKGNAVIRNSSGTKDGENVVIGQGLIINKTGKVYTAEGTTLEIENDVNSANYVDSKYTKGGLVVDGEITSDGNKLTLNNRESDIVINGTVNNNNGIATINNYSTAGGIKLNAQGRVNSKGSELNFYNEGADGIHFEGLAVHNNKDGKVQVTNKNSNVVIGHTDTESNITSNANVNINVENGNIYNYGVANRLIHMTDGAALNMQTEGGEIGLNDGNCGDACIGIGPDSRDFTKSINVTSDGSITAIANQGKLTDDVVVNIAGFNSDLNIDQVKADGKVLLTTADFDADGKGYSILNVSTDPTKANVEGKGIALIASDKIGEKDNKLTFNQTAGKFNKEGLNIENLTYEPTAEYGVDMLAINDINVKGQDDKYDTHVCTMISREGTIDAEFSGDTYIREITADKGLKVVTRGAELVIDNLGKVPNTPVDYFGPNGDIVPDEVVVKALDINPNTRVDNEEIDGVQHWANSHVIIKDGVVDDNPRVHIVGDDVYAGGYHFHMGKDRNPDGKTFYEPDDRTAMTTQSGDAPKIRVEAVRPGDVTAIGRDEDERNYYTGGSVQEDKPWYDDDDDDNPGSNIFPGDDDDDDDDHITVPEPGDDDDDDDDGPNPPIPGDDDDDDDDDGPNPPIPGDDDDDDDDGPNPPKPGDDDDDSALNNPDIKDGRLTWQRELGDSISIVDKRQYMRFSLDRTNVPVSFTSTDKVANVLDISRGGIAIKHNNTLKVGDVVPVHLSYGDVDIDTNVKIVTASDVRAGAEFIDLDSTTANRILYLNLLLEEDYKLSQGLFNQI